MVTGPSLRRETFMSAPKTPVSTRAPRSRRADTTALTRGAATGPGAAADQDGRRPLARSAYSVNWLITRSGAATSEQDFSPSRIRRPHSLAASFAACSGVSSWVTPTRTSSPGSSMAPTTRRSTVTLARLTRCTTARIARQGTCLPHGGLATRGLATRGLTSCGHLPADAASVLPSAPSSGRAGSGPRGPDPRTPLTWRAWPWRARGAPAPHAGAR